MINVKVFGTTPPCIKCRELTKRANNVAAKYENQVTVTKYDALSDEGDKYGILLTPSLVINEKLVATGKLISEEEIEKYVQDELGGK